MYSQGDRCRARTAAHGYILFEALIALTVLSVTIYVIQDGIRQAVIARGHAQDFTQARFLLEDLVNQLQLQPLVKEESKSGHFPGENKRFSWEYRISKVDLPLPPRPPRPPRPAGYKGQPGYANEPPEEPELPVPFLGKIEVTIAWTRSGTPFEVSAQTIFAPERLWLPPPPEPVPGQPQIPRGRRP